MHPSHRRRKLSRPLMHRTRPAVPFRVLLAAPFALLAACGAAPELAPDGKPVSITVDEIVAGSARQGTRVGAALPDVLRGEDQRDPLRVYLPAERWAPFMRVVAYLRAADDPTVELVEGVFEDEKGIAIGDPQLEALGIAKRQPIGTYTGRFRNWGGQDHRVGETYPLALYDTDRENVYIAWQSWGTYAVVHAASRESLALLRDYRSLVDTIVALGDQSPTAAIAGLELLTHGAVVPPSVAKRLAEQRARDVAAKEKAAAELAAWWAARVARWRNAAFRERLEVWAEVGRNPQARTLRRELEGELAAALRSEAAAQPLPVRYVLLQVADSPAEPTSAQIAAALAAADTFDADARRLGKGALTPLILPRGSHRLQGDDVAASGKELAAHAEQLHVASLTAFERIVYDAAQTVGDNASDVQSGLAWLRKEVARFEHASPSGLGSGIVRLAEECSKRSAALRTLFDTRVRPRVADALAPRLLAEAEALERAGRHATACVAYVDVWLLRDHQRMPALVQTFTAAAASDADDPLARARRCAIRALAAVEPPLSGRMRHAFQVTERLGQPPFSCRSVGYVLGLVPGSSEDLRSAAVIVGAEMRHGDLEEHGDKITIVARAEPPTHDVLDSFDAWAERYFPLPEDLRALGAKLRTEDAWLKQEFAEIEQQKAAIDAEQARIRAQKANMLGVDVAAHNAAVGRYNATSNAWNARNDAYKVRQSAFNSQVPAFNTRLASERWGKLLAFREKLDAAIVAWQKARLAEVREDDRTATEWLVSTGVPFGGPYLGMPQARPPAELVERELAWTAEDAFKQVGDKELLGKLEDFTGRAMWCSTSKEQILGRLRPLLARAIAQRDKNVLRPIIEREWPHFYYRAEVLAMFAELAKPNVR